MALTWQDARPTQRSPNSQLVIRLPSLVRNRSGAAVGGPHARHSRIGHDNNAVIIIIIEGLYGESMGARR